MFGRGWEPGQATIVALKEIKTIGRHGGIDVGGAKMKSYEFVADVHPAGGGAVFRTVMHEPFDERKWRRPVVGDVVAVTCDPRRGKAKFDTSAATDGRKAQREAEKRERAAQAAQFDAMLHAAPGTPVPSTGAARETGVVSESAGEATEGPSSNPRVLIARHALSLARRNGDTAEVERLTAVLAKLESGGGSESNAQ